ncbi:MAG: DUF2157 domain-containing protein [Pyrinomonadaceae bacterium]
MENQPADTQNDKILLTISDIRQAATDGIISDADSQNLIRWAGRHPVAAAKADVAAVEQSQGFNLITVAYYFGAMLMISACAWFLGSKWESLGSSGVLITTLIYFLIAAGTGWWLRGKGYVIGGGLLVTVAVCLVPLITYSIENLAGLWPGAVPGKYEEFYPLMIAIELATIAAAAIALWFVRFGFLTAPLAFSLWFFSMDVAALILGRESLDWNTNAWIGVGVGLGTMLIGYGLDRTLHTPDVPRSQDFGFWCYLFGLMAFWGCLTSMDSDSEFKRALYLLLNIGLVGIALYLKRTVFLVFGAIGIHLYLGHLAYVVFKDSFLFPFALALLGLSLILITVWSQSYLRRKAKPA